MSPPAWLRIAGWIGGFAAIMLVGVPILLTQRLERPLNLVESLQGIDSGITIVAAAVAGFFTMRSLAAAYTQRRALSALQVLRQAAHITDMLQSNKAPSKLLFAAQRTSSSPPLESDPVEIARYLLYCGELFAVISKLALLYGLWVPSATVLAAASDIEDLCASLEQRTSAKLLQLDLVMRDRAAGSAHCSG